MKIKCISNISGSLSEKAGYPANYIYESLIVGKIYNVYSIGHWDDYMFYLLKADHEDPDLNLDPVWFPYEWFEIVDHKIPDSWYFDFIGKPQDKLSTIIGYKEIVLNQDHHYGLMERDKYHLELFYKMKANIDK
ncbi:hypothetical protein [Paenibacillus sp. S-12]|uniref:hypothetical protein n=1 Tax=Paenibacillus sp. S-12 TaxID=3031371 RepID=UPI0025A2BA4D|nr:hypothetical protein [Paenibacillus sp. S-12]